MTQLNPDPADLADLVIKMSQEPWPTTETDRQRYFDALGLHDLDLLPLRKVDPDSGWRRFTTSRPILRHADRSRWVLPHKDLGGRFVPDFVIGHRWSGPTWEWVLVELQTPVLRGPRNPDGRLFMQNGRMSEQFDEGLRQINEWRRWISANLRARTTARSPRTPPRPTRAQP